MSDKHTTFLYIMLALSLLANGYAFGVLSQQPNQGTGHEMPKAAGMKRGPFHALHRSIDKVDPQYRAQIESLLDAHDPRRGKNFKDGPKMFKALKKVATSPDATLDDLNDVLDQLEQHHAGISAGMNDLVREIFIVLDDADERAAFFKAAFPDRMDKRRPGPPPHDGHPRHPED